MDRRKALSCFIEREMLTPMYTEAFLGVFSPESPRAALSDYARYTLRKCLLSAQVNRPFREKTGPKRIPRR